MYGGRVVWENGVYGRMGVYREMGVFGGMISYEDIGTNGYMEQMAYV